MKKTLATLLLAFGVFSTLFIVADADTLSPPVNQQISNENDFSFLKYRGDYQVHEDASSESTESVEILLKTKTAVDKFSQIRLSYSEKMESLEVLAAYTLTPEGKRLDVPADRIYNQESYASVSAPLYADRKEKIIIFPALAPGARLNYQIRREQKTPYFPGYFSLWQTFSLFDQYEEAEITLSAPISLPLYVHTTGVRGDNSPNVKDGRVQWRWQYRNNNPLKTQNWATDDWTFSPNIMVSSWRFWSQMAEAYQQKSALAAKVTPPVKKLADSITEGIKDRRGQAAALYQWVSQNIRYVAVYLGNGSYEPDIAADILARRYGDCKDHVVLLEALLQAKGIESSPVLIGAGLGPVMPKIPLLSRFNHAINYLPEFDLYLDSTSAWARFGQLPEQDMGIPVLHTRKGLLASTPGNDFSSNRSVMNVELLFDAQGNLSGKTLRQLNESEEIRNRAYFVQFNQQNIAGEEQSILAEAQLQGSGKIELHSDPADLNQPFDYLFSYRSPDYIDFSNPGGMILPLPPAGESIRNIYLNASAPDNATPFICVEQSYEETYHLQFPPEVPIITFPANQNFSNAAGEYKVNWQREGQVVTVSHRLQMNAIRGKDKLCQAEDYRQYRQLFQQVRRGFRGQVLYGKL